MQRSMLLAVLMAFLLSSCMVGTFAEAQEMTVEVQQKFDISLSSNPSTGYQWIVKEISDESIIRFVNSTFVSDGTNMPGAGGTEVLTFFAEKEGTATITLEYARSWMPDEPAETRTIAVTVGPAATIAGPAYLTGVSGPEGRYNVTVLWFSNDVGKENNFAIRVFDVETGEEVYDGLTLDFSIMQGDTVLVNKHMDEPGSPNTNETQFAYGDRYAFESEGNYSLMIANINGTSESVEFPMQVTPEFGSVVMVAAVLALAGTIAAGTIAKKRL